MLLASSHSNGVEHNLRGPMHAVKLDSDSSMVVLRVLQGSRAKGARQAPATLVLGTYEVAGRAPFKRVAWATEA